MICKFYVSFKNAYGSEKALSWKTEKIKILTSEQKKTLP